MSDPRIGRSIGRYRIDSVIGRGGMGVVYRATDDTGREVALKLMAPEVAGSKAFRERFLREAEVVLEHPHVIPIYDAGEADGELFIAMHYVAGDDLKKVILLEKRFEPARTVSLLEQAAGALDFAHENRIVHRDVKPQNILIEVKEGSEHVYLTDFGLIKRISPESSFTTGPYLMGTVYYMAPEQIEGHAVDGRADVYSLGCIAYECLTGSVPYDHETEAAVLWAHMNSVPPALTDELPLLPTEVDEVLAKAMARSPDDRFLTAGEFALSLGTSLGVSVARPRALWGSRLTASGRHRRPAFPVRVPVSVGESQSFSSTKGFLVGAAAMLVAGLIAFGMRASDEPRLASDQALSPSTSEAVADISRQGDAGNVTGADPKMSSDETEGDPGTLVPRSSIDGPLVFPPSEGSIPASSSDQPSGSGQSNGPRVPVGALENRTCQGLLPVFLVPASRVDPYVDDRFTLLTELRDDGSGNPTPMAQINVVTFSCDVDLAGHSLGQTERTIVAATIERPKASGPVDATFEFYVLSWFESNPRVADWYQSAPTFRTPGLERVTKLDQRFGPVGSQAERDVSFRAPPPASSPFSMEGVMDRPIPRLPPIFARWWTPHRRGALRIQDEVHEGSFPSARGTITIDNRTPDSLLERFFAPRHTASFNGLGNAHVSGVSITTKKVFVCGDKC